MIYKSRKDSSNIFKQHTTNYNYSNVCSLFHQSYCDFKILQNDRTALKDSVKKTLKVLQSIIGLCGRHN